MRIIITLLILISLPFIEIKVLKLHKWFPMAGTLFFETETEKERYRLIVIFASYIGLLVLIMIANYLNWIQIV